MKKSIKRTLSLLLALTMVLSLGLPAYAVGVPEDDIAISEEPAVKPANLPIGAGKQPGIIEGDEIISDDLIVDIVDEETVVEENAAPAKTFTYSESVTGFSVEVSAPVGALPLGTEMVVDRLVDLADVQAAVDSADNLNGEVQLAADISFWLNGQEIEPAEGSKLLVRMSAPEIEGIADPIVIHVPDGENAVPEIVEQMSADDDLVLVNAVEFEAADFSVYAVIGEVIIEDEEGTIDFESEDYTVTVSYTKEAKIPAGTKLTVSEIPYGSDEYFALRAAAQEKLNENAVVSDSELVPDTRRGIADAIFVDVSLEYNGEPFEPTVPLDVKITLKNAVLFCPAGEETLVVHFGENGTELIEDVALGAAPLAVPDGMPEGLMLNSFDYEQNGFSAVGLISTDKFIDFEAAQPGTAIPSVADLLAAVRAEGDPSINAGKTVTDNDGDGIYDLTLSVQATSKQSSDTKVTKSNVVMVIDVSGSMGNEQSWIYYDTYTYDAGTYDEYRYYTSSSSRNTELHYGTYYRNEGWGPWSNWVEAGTGWYSGNAYGGTAYSGTVYAYETRLHATQRAACAVVDALLAYNTNEYNISDMFEISVVKFASLEEESGYDYYGDYYFYNGTEMVIRDSTDATAIKNAINDLVAGGGTNWEAALDLALTEANYFKNTDQSQSHDPEENTSVIFLTDGFPTLYVKDNGDEDGDGQESDNNISTSYTQARPSARAIKTAGYTLYNIFAFGSDTNTHNDHTGFEYLCALTNYAYGTGNGNNYSSTTDNAKKYCFNAKSTADLIAAFKTIINNITNNVGFAGVNISDGVSLGATNTSVAVNGTAKADTMRYTVTDDADKIVYTVKFNGNKAIFTIHNADGTETTLEDDSPETVTTTINGNTINSQVYSVTVGEGENAKTYKMSPATVNADTGMVQWDLAGLGILESGYTYSVSFDVWPNQTAYDIAADLNNGIYTDIDAALTGYNITDDTERQHIKDAIVKNADGSYSLYTNYEQSVSYYPATETTTESGTTWSYGTQVEQDIDQPDPVPLQGSKLPLSKVWESTLALSELNELLWEDGVVDGTSKEYQITLYVWKADTEDELMTKVNTGVSETNQPYITQTLGWDSEAGKYIFEKNVAVAPGMMLNVAAAAELGYDVNDQTKLREFTNDQGKTLTYYVIEPGHYYYVTEEGSDLHFELQTVLYHPMIVDGTLYNVSFGEGKTVEKMDPMYAVVATNYLKGGININKIVTEADETTEIADVEDEFAFKITIWKEDENGNVSPVYTFDDQFESNNKAISGSIGYREFGVDENGDFVTLGRNVIVFSDTPDAEAKLTANKRGDHDPVYATKTADNKTQIILRMPANGEIRIVNLPSGTKYTVEEIEDKSEDPVYTYFKTVSTIKSVDKDGNEVLTDPVESTDNVVTGVIAGNKANVEKYYNKTGAYFYVYHSADNTVERIAFTDNRVKGTFDSKTGKYSYTFNLAEETKTGYIYGGYYNSYGKMGSGFDAKTATYTEAAAAVATAYVAADKRDKGFWTTDENGEPYEGDISFWTGTAYTENGLEREVKADDIYFLKEVPDAYLRGVIRYTYYDNADKTIGSVVFVSAIDEQYSTYGIIKLDGDDKGDVVGSSTALLKIKPVNAKDASSTLSVDPVNILGKITWNGKKLTDNKGFVGYNRVYDKHIDEVDEDGNVVVEHVANRCVADKQLTVMFWVTADGVQVTGTRNIYVDNIGGSADKASAKYIKLNKVEPVASTLTYVEPSETTEP